MQRVMIIADGVGRVALSHLLAGSDFEVVATVGPDAQVAAAVQRARPDLLLIDVEESDRLLPLLEDVGHAAPSARSVVLAGQATRTELVRVIAQGVRGFLLRENVTDEIVRTLREVAAGGVVIDPAVASHLVADVTRGIRLEGPHGLTRLEEQVLVGVTAELTNRQIGQRIGISTATVKSHLTNTFRKLGVRDRVEAAMFATEHGLG